MRTFIAIELPSDIKTKLVEVVRKFKKCNLDCKWVEPENLHITMKFLGEVKEEKIEAIKKIIAELGHNHAQLEVQLTHFGFFPNECRPRVFFIATSGEEILKTVAEELEEKLEELCFPKEGRFRSHITLARLKNTKNIDALKKEIQNITLSQTFPIYSLSLYKSTLTSAGPIYEEIFKAQMSADKNSS